MEGYNKIFVICKRKIKKEFINRNAIVGYAGGVLLSFTQSLRYLKYIGKHTVHFSEGYIQSMSGTMSVTLIFCGCLLVFWDAPFIDSGSFMLIHRTGRKLWYKSMWLYVVIQSFLYYLIVTIASLLPFITKGYLENKWSQTMLMIAGTTTQRMGKYGVISVNRDILLKTPIVVMMYTFVCMWLFGLLLCGVLFVWNIRMERFATGTIVVVGLYVISSAIDRLGLLGTSNFIRKINIFRNGCFPSGYDHKISSAGFSLCYFMFLIYLTYIIGEKIVEDAEFYVLLKENSK